MLDLTILDEKNLNNLELIDPSTFIDNYQFHEKYLDFLNFQKEYFDELNKIHELDFINFKRERYILTRIHMNYIILLRKWIKNNK